MGGLHIHRKCEKEEKALGGPIESREIGINSQNLFTCHLATPAYYYWYHRLKTTGLD